MEKIVFGKMIIYKDTKFNFIEFFNPDNGFLLRSDVFGVDKQPPKQRSFPELIDIGIMGTCHIASLGICKAAGIDCYQSALVNRSPNMSFVDFERLIKEASGKTFQIALGGAGDPNKHPDFFEMLKVARHYNIVPNLTTSGQFMTVQEIEYIKKYCGAVAVSFYTRLYGANESNPNTISAIKNLVNRGCVTNIHYVLSEDNIEEAFYRLKENLFPTGINAVIFLLYKAAGLGIKNKELTLKNQNFIDFLKLVENNNFPFKIGFDTCCAPAILKYCPSILENSLDFCEAARFSMYIDSGLNAYPCSFDCDKKHFKVNMKNITIKEAWESETFNEFRNIQQSSCAECLLKTKCSGKCNLNLCCNICS